jgi:hypothetical protein
MRKRTIGVLLPGWGVAMAASLLAVLPAAAAASCPVYPNGLFGNGVVLPFGPAGG